MSGRVVVLRLANVDPTVNDDSTIGVQVGDHWRNSSTKELFLCEDNSTSAAVWSSISKLFPSPANNNSTITSSTQWANTLGAPETVPNGSTTNLMTLFDNATDKVTGGTTSYNEFDISFGISITLSGSSGTADIVVDGDTYVATFDTDLFTTASNWVAANSAALLADGVFAYALGSGSDGRIRFSGSESVLNAITISNTSGDLDGTIGNEFTGLGVAANDHILIPYDGEPYDDFRLSHTIRNNFNIDTGSVQYLNLGLYRYEDDSLIGSTILVLRNPDTSGNQYTLETYTNDDTDPFVTGGFYLGLLNNSGTSVDLINGIGVLIQNVFQKPVNF